MQETHTSPPDPGREHPLAHIAPDKLVAAVLIGDMAHVALEQHHRSWALDVATDIDGWLEAARSASTADGLVDLGLDLHRALAGDARLKGDPWNHRAERFPTAAELSEHVHASPQDWQHLGTLKLQQHRHVRPLRQPRSRGAGRPAGRPAAAQPSRTSSRTTRSSARSGDSGDDGPGEPEPPEAPADGFDEEPDA